MKPLNQQAIEAHQYCIRNQTSLAEPQKCGCFRCERIFSSTELTDEDFMQESDGSYTAWCPYCGIDSIIGEAEGYEITPELLEEMKKQWF